MLFIHGLSCLQSGEILDVEAMADKLRAAHKEYQRRQKSVFMKQVERAFGAVMHRKDAQDPEAQLQVLTLPYHLLKQITSSARLKQCVPQQCMLAIRSIFVL